MLSSKLSSIYLIKCHKLLKIYFEKEYKAGSDKIALSLAGFWNFAALICMMTVPK